MTPIHEQVIILTTGKMLTDRHWMWDPYEASYLASFIRQSHWVNKHDYELTMNWIRLGSIPPAAKLVALMFIKYSERK